MLTERRRPQKRVAASNSAKLRPRLIALLIINSSVRIRPDEKWSPTAEFRHLRRRFYMYLYTLLYSTTPSCIMCNGCRGLARGTEVQNRVIRCEYFYISQSKYLGTWKKNAYQFYWSFDESLLSLSRQKMHIRIYININFERIALSCKHDY